MNKRPQDKYCLFIFVAILALTGCEQPEKKAQTAQAEKRSLSQPKIVATTNIMADLVESLLADSASITSLMGPGVDPHLYRASEGDVQKLYQADLIVYNGLHLEGKMVDILAKMNRQGHRTYAIAETLDPDRLIRVGEGGKSYDPHIWMDIALWAEAVTQFTSFLTAEYPRLSTAISENAAQLQVAYATTDQYVRGRINELPPSRRIMITAHDAFSYFGRAYAVQVRGLLGISTASEAGAADIEALADFIVEHKLPAIFVETSISDRYLKALKQAVQAKGHAVEIGGQLFSDALDAPGRPAGTLPGMIRTNVDTIVNALSTDVKP